MGFWEYKEKEYATRRADQYEYIDNPNKIAWISICVPIVLCLFFFVYCPMNNKELAKKSDERDRLSYNNFYKYPFYGIIKKKEFNRKRVWVISFQSLGLDTIQNIECYCKKLDELYEAVNIGDTILKPADTLLVKIFNSPKYEELNRYETFRKNKNQEFQF